MFTELETQILKTAALLPEPIVPDLITKTLRKTHRGIANAFSRLVNKGVLRCDRVTGYYYFLKQSLKIQHMESIEPEERQIALAAISRAWKQSEYCISNQLFHRINVQLAFDTMQPDAGLYLLRAIYDSIRSLRHEDVERYVTFTGRLDNEDHSERIRELLEQFNHWKSDPQGLEFQLFPHELLDVRTCRLAEEIWLLQEMGQHRKAELKIRGFNYTENNENRYFKAIFHWLSGRNELLINGISAARSSFTSSIKCLSRETDRGLLVEILFDLAKLHGMSNRFIREQKLLDVIQRFLSASDVTSLNKRLAIRRMESLMEAGKTVQALSFTDDLICSRHESSQTYATQLTACFGLELACRFNRPREAFLYADQLLDINDEIQSEFILHSIYAFSNLKYWDKSRWEQGTHAYLNILSEKVNRIIVTREQELLQDIFPASIRHSSELFDRKMIDAHEIDADQQLKKELLGEALFIARRLNDHQRWTIALNKLHLLVVEKTEPVEADYPSGYFKLISQLINCYSLKELVTVVKVSLNETLGVTSGGFLIRDGTRWSWTEKWGEFPETTKRKLIADRIQDGSWGQNSDSEPWIAIKFPSNVTPSGYLLIYLDPETTSGPTYDEIVKSLEVMIKPIAIIRKAISVVEPRKLKLNGQNNNSRANDQTTDAADVILGSSPGVQALRKQIRIVSGSKSTVHIHGETGVGKELVARSIHLCSQRKSKPFVAFNCATSTDEMIDSELFGHRRGAFTGAGFNRKGMFKAAAGGTLFLDEVAELPLKTQARLLRVLQEKAIRPIGSDIEEPVDVRIVSASHKKLEQEVKAGRFRQDLFYRLMVLRIFVPALRSNPDDIPELADYFLTELATRSSIHKPELASSAIKWMKMNQWKGNVRELRNMMEICVSYVQDGSRIVADDLIRWTQGEIEPEIESLKSFTQRQQKAFIQENLMKFGGNITKTAEKLSISRQGLFKKMKSLGIITSDETNE